MRRGVRRGVRRRRGEHTSRCEGSHTVSHKGGQKTMIG